MRFILFFMLVISPAIGVQADPKTSTIAENAFAGSSVNVVDGRRSGLFTHQGTQYAAYYDHEGKVAIATREIADHRWEVRTKPFGGNVADAHNFISMAVDGGGFLHLSWDHHNNPLNYARSMAPGSPDLTDRPGMIGDREGSVSYPQFYALKSGDLVFLYRDGASGRGNLAMNFYDAKARKWERRHSNLISGEGQRNAYWSLAVDGRDRLHLAWTWRETWDVSTNHDLMYAMSADGGKTWRRSTGEAYALPVTQAGAEVIAEIPQRSKLMNPPYIAADAEGNAYVTSYWSAGPGQPPQFHLAARGADGKWGVTQITARTDNFELAGGGTKRPPISRGLLLAGEGGQLHLVYRDDARDGAVLLASGRAGEGPWPDAKIWTSPLGGWEPAHDPQQWRDRGELHLLVQEAHQRDGDDRNAVAAEPAVLRTLELKPGEVAVSQPDGEAETAGEGKALGLDSPELTARIAAQYETLLATANARNGYPRSVKDGQVDIKRMPWDWTLGFFPGALWKIYGMTGEAGWREAALTYSRGLEDIKNNTSDHDVGFILMSSYGLAWNDDPRDAYRDVLTQGARSLATRFDPDVGCIRSWDFQRPFPVIIDNMMNLELLFWAADHGGGERLREIAIAHADTTLANHFRPDHSSYHLVNYNPETGEVIEKRTVQGAANDSDWARGQSWGLYGFTMMFRETGDEKYLRQAVNIAEFLTNHPNMPADKVPYWDYDAPGRPDALRDASAAAIMASALLELQGMVEPERGARYRAYATEQLESLAAPPYLAETGTNHGFLLRHSVGSIPNGFEIDVPLIYADYYFLEALERYRALGN